MGLSLPNTMKPNSHNVKHVVKALAGSYSLLNRTM